MYIHIYIYIYIYVLQGCMKFHFPSHPPGPAPGENDYKTNWEAFQKGRIEGKRKRTRRKRGGKRRKKAKLQKTEVWWVKKEMESKKGDFAGFQNRWNNIRVQTSFIDYAFID